MPFAFLAPVFLAGLAALAVPILIHLSSRPRRKTVEFPSLMFLEQVEYQDSSKRRLRHILLFALRCLALVLVAAAFARPFLDRPDAVAAAPDGGHREVVVLLDRSASMAAGARMERARDAVGSVADGLRRGDRATLVVFDHGAAAANRATDQPAVLRGAADTVGSGSGATRFAPALRLAESILSGTPLPRRELVLVTDFQRTAWDPDAAPKMPAGTEIRTLAVGGAVANTFVADVRFGRERFSGRERVRVTASVAHRPAQAVGGAHGAPSAEGTAGADASAAVPVEVPVELVMDGRVIETRTATVPSRGAAAVEFDPVTLPAQAVRGEVRAGTDALPGDNVHHFVLNAGRSLRVLVVEPRAGAVSSVDGPSTAAGVAAERAPYLVRALEVSPDHDVRTVTEDRLGGVTLAELDVVVLNGAEPSIARIDPFVRAGGGLVVVLGSRSRAQSWAGSDLMPGTIQGTRDAEAGAALTALRFEHPVLAPFRSGAAGLTQARFYRFRELAPVDDARVLARLTGGGAALVADQVERGRVAVVASPLDGTWSNLVLQPAFVPLSHQLVRWASGREPAPAWRTVGELLGLGELLTEAPEEAGPTGDGPVVLTPSDEAVPVDAGTLMELRERGFYEVRDPRGEAAVAVAVNGDAAESDPAGVDPETVATAISGGPSAALAAPFAPEDQERRQSLWWFFLAGAFVVMALETMLSNVLSQRPLPTVKGEGEG